MMKGQRKAQRWVWMGSMLAIATLAACSHENSGGGTDSAPATVQTATPADPAEAGKQLAIYRELLKIHNDAMASTIGQDIVARFPASPAAAEVKQTLGDVEARAKATAERQRLQSLWLYQVGPMEGGTQSTASLDSLLPSAPATVHLILRRHTDWGQSVFLFDTGHGFVCKQVCTISAHFDGHPHKLQGFLPPSGEPALFIKDDRGFIKLLENTHKIDLELEFQDRGKREVVFEVGGFDPSKWLEVSKHK
ncbi:hypothetical protein ACYJW8_11295 [Frateuria aurantia]